MKKLNEFTRRDFFVLVKKVNETMDRINKIEKKLKFMLCGRDSSGNIKRKRYGSLKQAKDAAKSNFWSEVSVWELVKEEDLTKENYVLKPSPESESRILAKLPRNCGECPYLRQSMTRGWPTYYCDAMRKKLGDKQPLKYFQNLSVIPKWCPLTS